MNLESNASAWQRIRLGDSQYFNLVMGQSPPGSTYNEKGQGLPFFQGKADFGELSPTPRVYCTEPTRIAQPNDVLISVRAPVGPTNLADQKCAIGRGLAAIRCKEAVSPRYLLTVLRAFEIDICHLAEGQGGGFTCLRKEQLADFEIPVPSFLEQNKIVDRIESMTCRLDELRTLHREAEAELAAFTPALLAKAFRGEL